MFALSDPPPVYSLVKLLDTLVSKGEGQCNFNHSVAKIHRRLDRGADEHPAFMSYFLKYYDKRGMRGEEIKLTFSLLALAGSGIIATLLSGCTIHLLTYLAVHAKSRKRIFATFKDDSGIRINSINHLPYLEAFLDKSFRIYISVSAALNCAVTVPGDTISGYFVPNGIQVGIPQHTAYHSPPELRSPGLIHPRALAPRIC